MFDRFFVPCIGYKRCVASCGYCCNQGWIPAIHDATFMIVLLVSAIVHFFTIFGMIKYRSAIFFENYSHFSILLKILIVLLINDGDDNDDSNKKNNKYCGTMLKWFEKFVGIVKCDCCNDDSCNFGSACDIALVVINYFIIWVFL